MRLEDLPGPTCPTCGAPIEGGTVRRDYCSFRCAHHARRNARRAEILRNATKRWPGVSSAEPPSVEGSSIGECGPLPVHTGPVLPGGTAGVPTNGADAAPVSIGYGTPPEPAPGYGWVGPVGW